MNQYIIYSLIRELQFTNDKKNPSFVGTFIINANDEVTARTIANNHGGKELEIHKNAWINSKLSECILYKKDVKSNEQFLVLKEYCSDTPIFKINDKNQLMIVV